MNTEDSEGFYTRLQGSAKINREVWFTCSD